MIKAKESTVIKDAILAGILKAFKHKITPCPEGSRTVYHVEGDIEKTLKLIYSNAPIGSLDALEGIKSTRHMIWAMREGQGRQK